MKKQISKIFLPLLICATLLMVMVNSAEAQTPTATPTSLPAATLPSTPVPNPVPTLSPLSGASALINPDVVTFSQLRQDEIQLNGPYASDGFTFAIPADWVLKDGIQLTLFAGISFNTGFQNSGFQSQRDVVVVGGGTLTVLLNNNVIHSMPLNEVGEVEFDINIPPSSFIKANGDERMVLEFVLDSGSSCNIIGLYETVYIHSKSYFNFPHDFKQPSTSLINFPRPIIQDSFLPDSALLVIPDQPTAAELQAALTVAAGLGNLGGNQLTLDMVTMGAFKEDLTRQNLIFIGKSGSLPILDGLGLPMPMLNKQFQFSDGAADDGLVGMVNSPWSRPHVVLVVSANTDAGVVKAAQAVSSGVIRPNRVENLALIEDINALSVSGTQKVDITLTDLGYQLRSFQSRGKAWQEYLINIPAGTTVSTESYFDMVYGHSSLIDYNNSQIVVFLNDQPIGSVRMSDDTAVTPTNHAKIMIPPLAVVPGVNRLSVMVNLEPLTDCTSPDFQGLWVNVWPNSLIHLPLIPTFLDPLISQDLAAYPSPFVYDPTLGNTAFVLERNGLDSWRNAMRIAAFLGNWANGPITRLSVFFGDAIPVTERSKYHLLVVGRPSQLPIVAEMNNDLPAPFLSGSDNTSESGSFQVTYRIPPDSPMGYLETIFSPWKPENVVLAILGNTAQGLNWATTALVDSNLRWQLGGNFAVVNDKQIVSSSTRYAQADAGVIPAEVPAMAVTPLSETPVESTGTRPVWILPAFIVSIVLMVLVIIVVFAIRKRPQTRLNKQGEETRGGDRGNGTGE